MDPRERLARLAQLKAEGDAIMQELMAAGMSPEQIMSAVEGGGQPMPQPGMGGPGMGGPGMGARPGPDLPPGIPQGGPPMGMPQGLLGPV
jgi:hypothetical protein